MLNVLFNGSRQRHRPTASHRCLQSDTALTSMIFVQIMYAKYHVIIPCDIIDAPNVARYNGTWKGGDSK